VDRVERHQALGEPWCRSLFLEEVQTMDSGMISKIEKAKRYAEERHRVQFDSFSVTFDGTNDKHRLTYDHGTWSCGCEFFKQRGVCSHTMAMERILDPMLTIQLGSGASAD
jgi:hypothetical protein